MKTLHKTNLILVIITAVLYLTLYLGMLFSMILGFVQVIMSVDILTRFGELNQKVKKLFVIYLVGTSTILTLIITQFVELFKDFGLFIYFIIPSLLALLHLYITYLISREKSNRYEL